MQKKENILIFLVSCMTTQSYDSFLADPERTLVVDVDNHRVLAPSRISSKTTGKRYVILTICMALEAEQLTLRFGKGPKHKLVVRELLGFETFLLIYIYIYVILLYIIYVLGLFSTLKGSISLSKYIIR